MNENKTQHIKSVRAMKAVVKGMFTVLCFRNKRKKRLKSMTCAQLNTLKQEEKIKYKISINKKTIKISAEIHENENRHTIKKNNKSKRRKLLTSR